MSVVSNNLLLAAEDGGYVIDRSVRLRSSAGGRFSRTPASVGNRQTFTFSTWVKRGLLSSSSSYSLFSSPQGANDWVTFGFSGDSLVYDVSWTSSSNRIISKSANVLRDPSAWYHVVFQVDTTQATGADRIKIYVNGQIITSYTYVLGSGYIAQNTNTNVNTTSGHGLGFRIDDNDNYFDGYLTEVNFIDGQALTPTSFGETDAVTGVWKPKKYAGSYGTNGFYLNFSDPASTTTIGYDYSGNGNNWTSNNISVTAGVTYDSMIDTPTPVADERGNFCVVDPIGSSAGSFSNGNLQYYSSQDAGNGTMAVSSGKWYWEVTVGSSPDNSFIGVCGATFFDPARGGNFSPHGGIAYKQNGDQYSLPINGSSSTTSYGVSYTANDVIGVALDIDSNTITFYKNNSSQGTTTNGPSFIGASSFTCLVYATDATFTFNFGQRPFAYTPPSGFKALHTGNLPEPTIVDGGEYFNSVTYAGNSSTNNISVGFQPDLFWIKHRGAAQSHRLHDAVRGVNRVLFSNATSAEYDGSVDDPTSVYSDGVTLTNGVNAFSYNSTGSNYVMWNWKANGAGVSNTDGSITSTVSAGVTQGFSVVTYTGNGSAGATIGHGLGVAPRMVIVQTRTGTNNSNKPVYHASIGNTAALVLDLTIAADTFSGYWNNTTPASTVFTVGNDQNTNRSGSTYVAYCFAEVPGFSKFGSYTGNGSADGPFVFCGFRPAFVMIKQTNTSGNDWVIRDNRRAASHNAINADLFPNTSGTETSDAFRVTDFLSNGFKIRNTGSGSNTNGSTYIYAAFAEHPFSKALAR